MKVLELAQIMSGPTCGLMLADMGADVIKLEKLPSGDDTRSYSEPRVNGASAPFLMLNRNKRGIALDLKRPEGRDIFLRLVRQVDVVLENFRSDTMDKLGLGYEVLARENPGLIYCAITGYGRTGPMAGNGGFDLLAQGFSGLMSITGEPGGAPVKCGPPLADIGAGMLATTGIVAAYVHKLKTGEGQLVDTSLMEAGLQFTYWHAAIFLATGQSPGPTGSAHVLTAPYQAFQAKDGWINIGGANQANWERITDVLGHPEWKADTRFANNGARMKHLPELVAAMNAVLSTRTRAEWTAAFDAAGVPAGPVHTVGEALTHPQALARGMVVQTEHPQAGTTRAVGCPVKFSAAPAPAPSPASASASASLHGPAARPAPLLGEHTEEVLLEFGFSAAEVQAALQAGVVRSSAGDSGAQ